MTIIILCLGQRERKRKHRKILFRLYLIEWNSDETRQTPLRHVFVDLAVHNAHSIPSILILLTNKNVPIFTFCQLKTKDCARSGSFPHKLQHRFSIFDVCRLSEPVSSNNCVQTRQVDNEVIYNVHSSTHLRECYSSEC